MKTHIALVLIIIAVFVMSVSPALAVFYFRRSGCEIETLRLLPPPNPTGTSLDAPPTKVSLPQCGPGPGAIESQPAQVDLPESLETTLGQAVLAESEPAPAQVVLPQSLETPPGQAFSAQAPPAMANYRQSSSSEFIYEKEFNYMTADGFPMAVPEPSGLLTLAAPALGAILYCKRRRNS